MQQSAADVDERSELRSSALDLLNETIARAVRDCPYYAESFRDVGVRIDTVSDLHRFPILQRETVVRRGVDLLARGGRPVTVGMTGGTTLGDGAASGPLLFFKSADEVAVKHHLLTALAEPLCPRPLLLHLVNLGHGLDPNGAIEGCFQVPLERSHHVKTVLSLLRGSFSFDGFTPRVTVLAGALRLLKALTVLCAEEGIEGQEFATAVVASSSNHLTTRWRTLLETYWQAEVEDFYGMSEVPGLHARRCDTCGHLHCSAAVVTEVLAIDRDLPVVLGVGRLIATSLYPLAAMQPMIRYDTGDLVEVFEGCPASEAQTFEFVGRRSHTIILPSSSLATIALPPVLINDVLDAFPDVAVTQFTFAQQLGIKTPIGFLKWGLRWVPTTNCRTLELSVELRWPPTQFPAASDTLRDRIRSGVLERSAALAELVEANHLDFVVTLREPGTTRLVAAV